jgi:hypothetical protein
VSGSNVTQWTDKSGTANNAVPGTRFGALGPTVTSSNSLLFTRVAGTSTQYLNTQSGRQTTSAVTYFLVIKPLGDNANGVMFDLRKATNALPLLNVGASSIAARGSTSAFQTIAYTFSTGFSVIVAQATTNLFAGFGNGTTIGSSTATMDFPAADGGYTTIGAVTDINYGVNATYATQINFTQSSEISEVIMYNSYLTTAQRQRIEGYLSWKWGLQGLTFPLTVTTTTTSPTQISGCQLWLDGDDPAGTGIRPANGASVTTWVDKSGNGRNAVNQTTAATFGSNFQNSRGVLQFVGTQNYLITYPSFPNTAYTIFSVQRVTNGTDYRRVLHAPASGDNGIFFGTLNGNVTTFTGNAAGAWNDINANTPLTTNLNTWRLVSMRVSESSLIPFVNGLQQYSKTGTTGTFSNLTIGTIPISGLQSWIGQVAEIIIYSSALTTSDRIQIERYLTTKWNIPTNFLPTTHPFASILPATTTFNPRQISNCALWLDAADRYSMTLSGSNVTQWNDKSGNGRNTSGVSGTPVLSTSSLSRQGVYFNGTSYFTGPFSYSSNTLSWFVVGTVESDGETFGRMLSLGAAGTFDFDSALRINAVGREAQTNEMIAFRNNVYIARGMNISYATPFMISDVLNGTSNFPFINGTAATGAASSGNFGFTTYGISGSFGTNIQRNKGFIFEVLIYTGALSSSERQQVEGYLSSKWALQNSLPSTHPYKKISPI